MATTEPITRRGSWVQTFLQKQLKYNFCKACFCLSSWGTIMSLPVLPRNPRKEWRKNRAAKREAEGRSWRQPTRSPSLHASRICLHLSAFPFSFSTFCYSKPSFPLSCPHFLFVPPADLQADRKCPYGVFSRETDSPIFGLRLSWHQESSVPLPYPQVHLPGPSLHFKRFVSIVTKGRTEPLFQLGPIDFQPLHLKS